eukprot:CAMPEP_0194761810 /NCGR_PEP_ID=MMETSP0323_2-20130528/14451_1 /TAXON_ID=2866 ORGANISM="Crypthecodinium cohnii, Strain Seligo" /NCGR_SAMPLE_ID=MMETSP0323_2 /ASSEMBLY_ACC=CAM_ASM_000346 /LENGTH=112 /DNA_ID=CAMNT_0039683717 /DNA_START=18 /DNA_END=356 /DNA_ORIENTATION=+
MALLLASAMTRASGRVVASNLARRAVAPIAPVQRRTFVQLSKPSRGHNLEDHFDFAEFVTKMHHPLGEYLVWFLISTSFFVSFGPLLHSNYYFTGRFLPKDQGNTQLCEDSW